MAGIIGQYALRRDRQARAFARRWRLVVNAASERDKALRGALCHVLNLPEDTSSHDLIRAVQRLKESKAILTD
jgi:hypothetical protein